MRGNKDIFYCHLLPFVTTYCHKTAKNAFISAISIDYFFKNVLIPSKNIAYFNEKCNIFFKKHNVSSQKYNVSNSIKKREKHTPMDMSTYARENGYC